MSKFFINRPIFATVISLLAMLAGLVSLINLPIAQYPEITPPTIMVSANYPGASPELIAASIGSPIEEQVNGVEGMMYMSSYSGSGQYNLTITFNIGVDVDMANVMVQNKINPILNTLPASVVQQGLTIKKQESNMLMIINLLSKDSIYDGLYLSNYATLNIVDELSRINGVGNVMALGAGNYSMRIWLDPVILASRGVSVQDVMQALESQNIGSTAGSVGTPPGSNNIAYSYAIQTAGQLTSVDQFENIIIRSTSSGQYLRLKDIAQVDLGSFTYSTVSKDNGMQTSFIGIAQSPGANALQLSNEVKAKMESLSKYFPSGVYYDVSLDTTDFIRDSIQEVIKTFFETMLIVILVILLFLQNWRAVIIPSITIPVSLISTFAVMNLLGFSINMLTLFGLILAIAIVVDDAIMVVENTYRLMESDNLPIKDAVIKAMEEITGPIVAIVLVMLAVFVPTAFIGGITGQLFRQFALTIAASTFISGLCSLTLTPALCALFLKPEKRSKFFIYDWFDKFYAKVANWYGKTTMAFLKKAGAGVLFFVICAAGTFYLFSKTPTSFIPEEDQGYFFVSIQLPDAAGMGRTEQTTDQVREILSSFDEISSIITVDGYDMLSGSLGSNSSTVWVSLKNWKYRTKKDQKVAALVSRFNGIAYETIQTGQVFAFNPPAIPGLGTVGGLNLVLEDINNLGQGPMMQAIQALEASVKDAPAIESITSQYSANVPKYQLNIDKDKIRLLGLTYEQVNEILTVYSGTAYINNFPMFGRIFNVVLGGAATSRQTIEDILNLQVQNSQGQMVPFSAFATVEYYTGVDQINRYDLYNAASIICNTKAGYSSGQGMQQMEQLVYKVLGKNYGYEWTGMAYQEATSSSGVMIIYVLAFIVAILVLAAQYESWTNPFAVVMGIPFALLGVIVGCIVMHQSLSVYSQIGMVLLMALSAKNGILIVAFARDKHNEGLTIRDSAVEAGKLRLRPILMTSFAFVFGVMPLLFASGAGADSRISLGTAVVFGMAFNTVFGTVVIPMFYDILQKLDEKLRGKKPVTEAPSQIKDNV
ncbi:MAG: efflux RND transporter permease subunit [Tannerellaceae bacterium]